MKQHACNTPAPTHVSARLRQQRTVMLSASGSNSTPSGTGLPSRIGTLTTSQSIHRQNWKKVVLTPRAAVRANTRRACTSASRTVLSRYSAYT